jgi:hypothetical protein
VLFSVPPLPDDIVQRQKDLMTSAGEVLGDSFLVLVASVDRPPLARPGVVVVYLEFHHGHTASHCDLQRLSISLTFVVNLDKGIFPNFTSSNYRV